MTALLAVFLIPFATDDPPRPTMIVVVGAAGNPEYEADFGRWADGWKAAAHAGGASFQAIGRAPEGSPNDREQLHSALVEAAKNPVDPLWIVLIGHGSFDGREAKFNLRGPDVADAELAGWLKPLARPVAVLDCSSASAPFLNTISETNRIVVTATRSGDEREFSRFGQYLAESYADLKNDLDKDGQVSLLEAFLSANHQTQQFYKTKSRLSTEHPLIDDNGDARGTPGDAYQGLRVTKAGKNATKVDGRRAHQWHLVPSEREKLIPREVQQKRDQLELAVAALRDRKSDLAEDAYYQQMEALLVELAGLDREASQANDRK